MTSISRELQSLKEASDTLNNHAKEVLERAREIVARLYVEGGIDALQAIASEFTSLTRDGCDIRKRYADEIAAIHSYEAERKEREAILDAEMERKIKDHNEKIAAIVREAREQAGLDTPYPPAPGTRLTASQLRDAPDGTVVRHFPQSQLHLTKSFAGWSDASGCVWPDHLHGHILVRWGCA